MRWYDVCAPKSIGGLNLVDPEEALRALMAKWVLKALGPGDSNLQILRRHRIKKIKPDRRGRWPQSLQWILTHKFSSPRGYRIWNRLMQAWKNVSPKLDLSEPTKLLTALKFSVCLYGGLLISTTKEEFLGCFETQFDRLNSPNHRVIQTNAST